MKGMFSSEIFLEINAYQSKRQLLYALHFTSNLAGFMRVYSLSVYTCPRAVKPHVSRLFINLDVLNHADSKCLTLYSMLTARNSGCLLWKILQLLCAFGKIS